jgi:hypothetical protein
VDLGHLVRLTVDNLDLVGERTVLVEAEHVRLTADPAKIERIVENMIANAARPPVTHRYLGPRLARARWRGHRRGGRRPRR